ncbi:MAG TPA: hypothetical protein VGH91_11005 [Gammaproteobacteria bacterium]|jgi:hypothetical protein
MTGVRVVSLVLRVIALWCVLLAVQSGGIVVALQNQSEEYPHPSHWIALFPVVVFLIVAVILWIFSLEIARKLYVAEKEGETFHLDAHQALRVGCCLLGLWLLPSVVPSVIRIIAIAYESSRIGASVSFDTMVNQALYVLAELVIAIVLLAKNRPIARALLGREQ